MSVIWVGLFPNPYIKTCTILGCNEPHHGKGLCIKHYNMWAYGHRKKLVVRNLRPDNRQTVESFK
ncbi:hypothetical protein NO1_0350 [Candidatus Termititenax aidoneus]|uniref:Uncharacterized protein n=1 Tax=Termititenax aidoneus TaxID=2218524 RepID=A0A388T9X4_TERA1|nr:hypothetical protein NO1_0350 [Candidatus Termititenax aidoneus]